MSDYDSMFISSERSLLQVPCPVTRTPPSSAVLFIEKRATFLDTLSIKSCFSVFNQLIRWIIFYCRKVVSKIWNTSFLNSGFGQLQTQRRWSDGSRGIIRMYLRDPLYVLRKQVSVLEKTDDLFSDLCTKSFGRLYFISILTYKDEAFSGHF